MAELCLDEAFIKVTQRIFAPVNVRRLRAPFRANEA